MKKYLIILNIIIFTFNVLKVKSNELNSNHFYGLYSSYGLNKHNADFKRLPDCPSCSPSFRDGSGLGLSLGFVYDCKISSDFYFSSKLSYNDLSGKLVQKEATNIIVNSNLVDAKIAQSLNIKQGSLKTFYQLREKELPAKVKLSIIDNIDQEIINLLLTEYEKKR